MARRFAHLWAFNVAMALAVLLVPSGAGAIIGGTDDGGGHPNVAFVLAVNQAGSLAEACTGTLISPTAVLTAAHCLHDAVRYFVSFDPTIDLNTNENVFLPTTPGFQSNDVYDVGVLRLAQATTVKPAELPDGPLLDGYRKGTDFTHVGYGEDSPPSKTPYDFTHFTRRTLAAPLTKLSRTQLFTRSPDGSLCKGDSGGPVFSPDGILVALGNYANARCQGVNSGPRLDIEAVRSFLNQ